MNTCTLSKAHKQQPIFFGPAFKRLLKNLKIDMRGLLVGCIGRLIF